MMKLHRIPNHYNFPPIDEEEHRFKRLSGAAIAICVALLPFFLNLVWRIYADDEKHRLAEEIIESGFPDLALAGVVLAVSTYTNTCFSVKLFGWQAVSGRTFVSLLFVTLTSTFSFVAYLESIHEKISVPLKGMAFCATLLVVAAGVFWSWIAHYCFLEDEFRFARNELKWIPAEDISDWWM